jgi:predicted NUDIX family NTP pyrophosphohydrolase
MPTTVKAGATPAPITIKVTNGGTLTWSAGNVHLGYHWAQGGNVVVPDGIHSAFASDVPPCSTVSISASFKAPPAAGTYQIRWDMVDNVGWFSVHNVQTGNVTVTVKP